MSNNRTYTKGAIMAIQSKLIRADFRSRESTRQCAQTGKQKAQNAGTQIHCIRSALSTQVNNNKIIGDRDEQQQRKKQNNRTESVRSE